MPPIHVRDVPDNMYRLLAAQAAREGRSIAQQVVVVLARGLEVELDLKARRRELLRRLQSAPLRTHRVSDPAKLIREDRGRLRE